MLRESWLLERASPRADREWYDTRVLTKRKSAIVFLSKRSLQPDPVRLSNTRRKHTRLTHQSQWGTDQSQSSNCESPSANASYPAHWHAACRRRDGTDVLISWVQFRGPRAPDSQTSARRVVRRFLSLTKRKTTRIAQRMQRGSHAPDDFALGHMRSRRRPKWIADDLRPEDQRSWRQHSEASSVAQDQPAITAHQTSKRKAIRLSSTVPITRPGKLIVNS